MHALDVQAAGHSTVSYRLELDAVQVDTLRRWLAARPEVDGAGVRKAGR